MPSSVVIALPLTAATGVTHDRISFPSSSTEHAPHWARPHPNLGPCRCSSLCSTYSSGVSRLAVTLCTRPFTLIFSLLANVSLLVSCRSWSASRSTECAPSADVRRRRPALTSGHATINPGLRRRYRSGEVRNEDTNVLGSPMGRTRKKAAAARVLLRTQQHGAPDRDV